MLNNDKKNLIVKKSHELINARYSLPVAAQKLICYCTTKIKDDIDFKEIEITAKELQMITNVKNPYEELKHIANQLFQAEIYTNKDGKFIERKRWVTTLKYYDGEGRVTFEFHPDVKPWLIQVKDRVLKYSLDVLDNFYSKYSIRLYELLIENRVMLDDGTYYVDFDLDYLKEILILEDKYPKFTDLRRYVLLPAIQELQNTNISDLSFIPIKKGRTTVGVKFTYKLDLNYIVSE